MVSQFEVEPMGIVSDAFRSLTPDPWRNTFSQDLQPTLDRILSAPDPEVESAVSSWLAQHQPCLFGKIAAKRGLLRYCLLREPDLEGSDEDIRSKIQKARLNWTRDAYQGRASGFIIVVISDSIARARPNSSMLS